MINYRALFDDLRIPYVDKGANTSKGRINITCPWCRGADPSYHLSIDEETDKGYYCYRSYPPHSGKSIWLLLKELKVPHAEMERAVERHSLGGHVRAPERSAPAPEPSFRWDDFPPASESREALDYLAGRGFDDPQTVARRCDLRVVEEGRLARRILLPITDGRRIIGYTARAMYARIEPKYWTHPAVTGGVYVPIEPLAEKPLFLVEGPFDALKLWAASGYNTVGLLGLALPLGRQNRLRPLLQHATKSYLVLDRDQDKIDRRAMCRVLQRNAVAPYRPVLNIDGPAGVKDIGDASLGAITEWIRSIETLN